jgi:hypothetical protein
MSTEAITLEVDSDAASAFRSASIEERKKLVAFFSYCVKLLAKDSSTSLRETMDQISRNANARGLTPEILESIVRKNGCD